MNCNHKAGRTAASLRKLHPLTADLSTQIKVIQQQPSIRKFALNFYSRQSIVITQVTTVVMEVTHASPKIAAMEFFDVNIRLLPTVHLLSLHTTTLFLLFVIFDCYIDSIDLISIVLPFQLIGSTLTYVAILHQVAAHSK